MTKRLQLLLQILADAPKDPFTLFAIAKEYEGMGDPVTALAHYLLIKKESPDYVGMYYHLGKLQEKLNALDDAVKTYSEGMEIAKNAKDIHAFNELAGAKLQLADPDEDE